MGKHDIMYYNYLLVYDLKVSSIPLSVLYRKIVHFGIQKYKTSRFSKFLFLLGFVCG